jgi:peptidoglycan/LPS O-acetylase OafA/YrhL
VVLLRPFRGLEPLERLKYIDGMRGWASLFVLFFHVFVDALPPFPETTHLRYFLPFNGGMAVFCFFVISGISLSFGYLATGNIRSVARIASARYFRLAIPVFVACLVVHIALVCGLVSASAERMPQFRFLFNFEPTTWHLLCFALFDVFFRYSPVDTYIGPLWTMQPELFGSAITLVAVVLIRPLKTRWVALVCVSVALFAVSDTESGQMLAIFPTGILIADIILRGWPDKLPVVFAGLAVLAGGVLIPALLPYSVLSWGMIAAPLLIAGLTAIAPARAFMSNRISQWLGWLSFPLYLVHGPVICIIGEPLFRHATSTSTRLAIDALVLAVSIAAAIPFAQFINDPAVRISRWVGRTATESPLMATRKWRT